LSGDKVLVEVAALFKENLGPNSRIRVCRIGGDEFAVVFKHETYDSLAYFTTINKQIEEFTFDLAIKNYISLSVGLIDFQPFYSPKSNIVPQSVQELFNLADNALYEAKRKGKNQIHQVNQPIKIIKKTDT